MNPQKISSNLAFGFATLSFALMSFAAEPAKPGSGAGNAGIIVLDGKTPPGEKGAKVSTGIGLGGCAACDKPVSSADEKAAKLKNATKAPVNAPAK
jgi:hypothetical protein